MTTTQRNLVVIAAAILITALPAVMLLLVEGFSDERLRWILRVGARVSLILFLLAFVARPLRQLLKTPFTAWLLANRRLVGLAFATVHFVHLAFIALRFSRIPGLDYPLAAALGGGATYAVIAALAITSFDGPARAIGRSAWRWLHRIGVYWIFVVFAQTVVGSLLEPPNDVAEYLLAALLAAALLVRVAAFLRRPRARGPDA